ncbi:hypothetical protein LCGC14_0762260 [marine sediment metagenome]|uniref:Cytidyltransferase-like domain-containing protein n=1 Tax=marine sediment metagenome TaxID=412755 RepID=A0A0F9T7S1_9ZZZZ
MPLTDHLAIFGGSMDPPHIGHQISCMWLRTALNAQFVHVVPTFEHCFGKKLSDFKHRVEMVKRMCEPFRGMVCVSEAEEDLPKPNITYNLLQYYKGYSDKIAVVIGSDLIPDLHKWAKWEEVADESRVIAIGRFGFKDMTSPLSIYQYPIELSAVSSSDIRKRIAEGQDITGLVPKSVKDYIEEHGLYK